MGPRKLIKWTKGASTESNRSNTEDDGGTGAFTAHGPASRKKAPIMRLPSLPFRSHLMTKHISRPPSVPEWSILKRRGMKPRTQKRLTLQPSGENEISPKYRDPDFFDDDSTSGNLSLEDSCSGCSGNETPVAPPTPETAISEFESFRKASLAGKASTDWTTPHTSVRRLGNFSRVSLGMLFLFDELRVSSPGLEVDNIMDGNELDPGVDRGSTVEGKPSTLEGPPGEASLGLLIMPTGSSSPDKSLLQDEEQEKKKEEGLRKGTEQGDGELFHHLATEAMHDRGCVPRRKVRPSPTDYGSKACKLPIPHPQISQAQARIHNFICSPLAKEVSKEILLVRHYDENNDDAPREVKKARQRLERYGESREFLNALQDSEFVKLYTAEWRTIAAEEFGGRHGLSSSS